MCNCKKEPKKRKKADDSNLIKLSDFLKLAKEFEKKPDEETDTDITTKD